MHLLQNDIHSAEQTVGNALLQATSIPYARYTIFVCLANIELAVAKKEYSQALQLIEELLDEVTPLTRVDIPEVLRWKGIALLELNRLDEAHRVLTQACSLAKNSGSNPQLWLILASLADVNMKLGNDKEAESNLEEARTIIEQIAKSLREIGLAESFLNQPRVKTLMR